MYNCLMDRHPYRPPPSVIISLLVLILLTVTSNLPGCQTGRNAMDLSILIPETVGTWSPTADYPDSRYDQQTIFDYMNGAGEVFLSFAFQGMFVRHMEKPDEQLTIELYDMGNPADAFGIFARSRSGDDIGIGQGSQYWSGQINFWKDRYYISVFTLMETEESKNDVFDLARAIAANIPDEGQLPAILSFLPPEDLREETIRYFHLHTDLNRYYFISDNNLLGLDPTTEAIIANYERGEEYRYLLVVRYPDPERAGEVFTTFHDTWLPEVGEDGAVEIEDGLWSSAVLAGPYIISVFDAKSAESARELLAATQDRIEGVVQ